jgi:hypothetical protein
MIYLVQFSTGAGSAEVAWRAVERYGPDGVHLLTADTAVEDEDNWRFAREVVAAIGDPRWDILRDGRTPMEVGRDHRAVPSDRMAICSRVLKRDILRKHIEATYDPADAVIVLGYDWTEPHRLDKARPLWAPWNVECPLMEPPYLWKQQILDGFRARGIEPPRLYAQGFAHANCGGACVRGGHAQWDLLLRVNRPLYLEWEHEEERTRDMLGKDVAILTDRRGGGPRRPLPLRVFREARDSDLTLETEQDWGACGCQMLDDDPETA